MSRRDRAEPRERPIQIMTKEQWRKRQAQWDRFHAWERRHGLPKPMPYKEVIALLRAARSRDVERKKPLRKSQLRRKAVLGGELRRMLSILIRKYRPETVILFGSLATGKVHEWSDIDLAVVKRTSRRFLDRMGEVLRITHPKVGLSVVVYTPEEADQMQAKNHYFWIEEILGRGKILYDRAA